MKKVKKKVKLKFIPLLLMFLILVMLFFLFKHISKIKPSLILIRGNELLSDREIINEGNLREFKYFSFNNTSKEKLEKNYPNLSFEIKEIEKNKIIKKVDIKRKFLFTIEVTIEEKKVILYEKTSSLYILEDNEKVKINKNIEVPVLNNKIINTVEKSFINKFSLLNKSVKYRISEIFYQPTEYDSALFLMYMKDGNHVYVNVSNLEKLNHYDKTVESIGYDKKGIFRFDALVYNNIQFKLFKTN